MNDANAAMVKEWDRAMDSMAKSLKSARERIRELEAKDESDEQGRSVSLEARGAERENAKTFSPQWGERESPAHTPNEGGDPPLRISREYVDLPETGYFVRAMHWRSSSWDTYDIIQLNERSLEQWLRHWNRDVLVDMIVHLLHGGDHGRKS